MENCYVKKSGFYSFFSYSHGFLSIGANAAGYSSAKSADNAGYSSADTTAPAKSIAESGTAATVGYSARQSANAGRYTLRSNSESEHGYSAIADSIGWRQRRRSGSFARRSAARCAGFSSAYSPAAFSRAHRSGFNESTAVDARRSHRKSSAK